MQALLFGTTGLNLFGPADVQARMLAHLDHVMRIAAGLGAESLVFGSPKNRDRSGLDEDESNRIATEFFRTLGDMARVHDVRICLEPNPSHYGANFMTTSAETARVVRLVDHPSIAMQLDTGAMILNGETPGDVISSFAPLLGHVHVSEPDLLPLGDLGTDHRLIHAALEQFLPNRVVTIEMLATSREPHLAAIERALDVATRCYR